MVIDSLLTDPGTKKQINEYIHTSHLLDCFNPLGGHMGGAHLGNGRVYPWMSHHFSLCQRLSVQYLAQGYPRQCCVTLPSNQKTFNVFSALGFKPRNFCFLDQDPLSSRNYCPMCLTNQNIGLQTHYFG